MEIVESNELIAGFMGLEHYSPNDYKKGGKFYTPEKMGYATSWDWLMPVVEKVELSGTSPIGVLMSITNGGEHLCSITVVDRVVAHRYSKRKIKSTYQAVVEFIKWNNKKKED